MKTPSRLEKRLGELKARDRKALVAFFTAGFPDMETTIELVRTAADNGADVIELGVPFSDPMADGPTIQSASEASLRRGTGLTDILAAVRDIRARVNDSVPILLMSYLNPLYHGALGRNIAAAAKSGVDGFIVPDIIPEEAAEADGFCRKHGLSLVYLAAPNTPEERLSAIDRASTSFVYVVSLTGVTGGRKELSTHLKTYLAATKRRIAHPRFLGFGISGPEQVRRLRDHVDGVIVGSALIDIIRNSTNKHGLHKDMEAFIKSLRNALDA